MLKHIIGFSLKNRALVILFFIFVVAWGIYSMKRTPLDAIPDLSDVQVIIFTKFPGQAPQIVEDQITYPLTTAMLSVPFAKVVRGYSFFGFSFVYIIFEDGTDMYWARRRVLEQLNFVSGRLPSGVNPTLGPDATGVGWVYEYALIDKTGRHDLAELRSLQDWYLRYELQTVPGVSEVASIGGYVKQYQVEVDPNKLIAYNIPLNKIAHAIRRSNNDVGGKLLEMAGRVVGMYNKSPSFKGGMNSEPNCFKGIQVTAIRPRAATITRNFIRRETQIKGLNDHWNKRLNGL